MTTAMSARAASKDEFTVGADRISFSLTSEAGGGEVAVCNVTIPPAGGPPVLHRHDPFELYRVGRGELAFYIEGEDGAIERTVAGPGGVIPIPGDAEHTIRNESDREAEATAVFSPGEAMERFVRAVADLGTDPAPGAEEVHSVAEAHGIEITRSLDEAFAAAAEQTAAEPAGGSAYLTIARFPGDGDRLLEEYLRHSETMSEGGRDHGLILHAAAKAEDGLMVLNLWPSQEGSESAARDPRRLGVVERAEIDPGQIRREHYEVAHLSIFDVG